MIKKIDQKNVEIEKAKLVFSLELIVIINESWYNQASVFLIIEHWSPWRANFDFLKKIKMNNYRIIPCFLGYFLNEKIPYAQICGTTIGTQSGFSERRSIKNVYQLQTNLNFRAILFCL